MTMKKDDQGIIMMWLYYNLKFLNFTLKIQGQNNEVKITAIQDWHVPQ